MFQHVKPLMILSFMLTAEMGIAHADSIFWKIGTTKLETVKNDKTGWMINLDCNQQVQKGKPCKAYDLAKTASLKKISNEDRRGGKNPASVMCKQVLGGKVFIAKDPNGNQNSFCLFDDRSFISNDSLMRAAHSNDQP